MKKIKNNKINICFINNDEPQVLYKDLSKEHDIMIYYMIENN